MFIASYLLSSTGIRYKKNNDQEMKWLEKIKPSRGLKPEIIAERADRVFKLLPNRIKYLVIVNGNISNFEMIQACVKVAEKYSDNIIVIPSLLARMTHALRDIAKLHHPPPDELILVVTINNSFIDYVILKRDHDFQLNIVRRSFCNSRNECMKELKKIYDQFVVDATVVLVHDKCSEDVDRIRNDFKPANLFVRFYKRWDYLLMSGALLRAPDVNEREFDERYQIPNFSMGIETNINGGKNLVILADRTRIPCKIYGVDGTPRFITLFDDLILESKEASKKHVWLTGSSDQVIGYFDDRGVPYISTSTNPVEQALPHSPKPTADDALRINFIFEKQYFGAEIIENGVTQKVKGSEGNERIPLYLSMADGIPEIGEKAKNDYQKFPQCVIYDVFEIIGKPLNKIKIDPKWGFKLTDNNNGDVHFQIETPSGPRLIPQEIVLSAFMKSIKLKVESKMGNENHIDKIHLSTTFRLPKSQKEIFEKAAAKNNLQILSTTTVIECE
uniref:Uncharacterized protein n=1 Tax=Panagrolaimus sp. PS1159 TaxID=55785 RepID=A0AC35GSS1_9BILA